MRKRILPLLGLFIAITLAIAGCNINIPGQSQETTTTPPPIQSTWTPPPVGQGGPPLPSVADLVPNVTPSVVSIQTEAVAYDVFLRPYPEQGAGSGVIIDPNGYILTNNHVVEGAQKITVSLSDGRTFTASDTRRDPNTDVAIIKVDATGLPTAKLGDSSKLRVGDWVVAVGNALALEGGPTVTAGIVSYLGRSIMEENNAVLYDLIQTDAAINPGNSGGPLLNMSGEVVGINTAIAGEGQNIGFAISINSALPVLQSLITKGFIGRPFLGVTMDTVSRAAAQRMGLPVDGGVLIVSVSAGTPAERAGMKEGDVVVKFAGKNVTKVEEMRQAIFSQKVGDIVDIVLYRGGTQTTVSATLAESPPPK